MIFNIFLYLGILFLAAYGVKLISLRVRLPEVTGYVMLGVILGISVLKFLNDQVISELSSLSSIALGLIAFIIGIELKMEVIRKLGKSILFIAVFEGIGAFVLVMLVIHFIFPGRTELSILLGAVASATAPAATVAVIRQYKARGPLTSTILAVVGIDDAIALIIYVFASSFVKGSLSGLDIDGVSIFLHAAINILISVGIGIILAVIFTRILRKVRNNDWIAILLAAFILGILGLCEKYGFSELLSIMVFGAVVVNTSAPLSKKSETIIEGFSPVFLAAFFILGGARLELGAFQKVGMIGLFYFLARSTGKIAGATIGALLGRAQKSVRRYVGFALLPQVGIALALALSIEKDFHIQKYGHTGEELSFIVINVLLFTTIITEVVGPLLTRTVLSRAGEIKTEHGKDGR